MVSTITYPLSKYTIEDYYISASLSSFFSLISIVISSLILILVWRTKHRLHTIKHLLICNTCIASILFCIVTINNYIYLIFIQSNTSDINCRWRGYFAYLGIAGVLHSYMIQAISRSFFNILSGKYRWLTTFKAHYILIGIQWFVVICITLPCNTTNDIRFSINNLCWIPVEYTLHTLYTYVAYYIIPVLIVIIIYFFIFYQVKKIKRNSIILTHSIKSQKRDIEVLRNIIILISIYLGGGLPTIMGDFTSISVLYLISLVTQSFTILIANLSTGLLDRDIRKVIKSIVCQTTPIIPFNAVYPLRRLQ